jgi:hypothetical protein
VGVVWFFVWEGFVILKRLTLRWHISIALLHTNECCNQYYIIFRKISVTCFG